MLESILLYIKQGLNAHLRAFSPIIIIEDHIYRLLFTHSNYRTPFSTNNLKIIFSPAELSRIIELRKYRNALVHGALIPEIKNLKQMTNELKTVCNKLQNNYHKDILVPK